MFEGVSWNHLRLFVRNDLADSNAQIRVPTDLKNPEIMEMLRFGLLHKQIEKLQVQIEPE